MRASAPTGRVRVVGRADVGIGPYGASACRGEGRCGHRPLRGGCVSVSACGGADGRVPSLQGYASMCAASQFFSSTMGTRTWSMVSRSRMVTALSASTPFSGSPTVSKSTVTQ